MGTRRPLQNSKQLCTKILAVVSDRFCNVKKLQIVILIVHRAQSASAYYYIKTEAKGRGFNEDLQFLHVTKPNYASTVHV